MHAFRNVLSKRQSRYGKIIEWLDGKIGDLERKEKKSCEFLKGVVGRF